MIHSLLSEIPNALSLGRLALGVAFPWVPLEWQFTLVVVAGLSDLFDGSLGRWTGSTSTFGQMLDPIADKIFILGALVTLVLANLLTISDLLLLGFRDFVVLGICLWVAAQESWSHFQRMRPLWTGKLATGAQFTYLIVLLWSRVKVFEIFLLTVSLSVIAGLHYAWAFSRAFKQRSAPGLVE